MVANTVPERGVEQVATALLISSFEYDHIYFDSLFHRTNWKLFRARTGGEAVELLNKFVIPVVVVDERIEPDGWKGILAVTQQLACPPKLIVASLLTTDDIWADVLNLGGYDVLARPLEQQEVMHSISVAWLAWKTDVERAATAAGRLRPLLPGIASGGASHLRPVSP